MTITVWNHEVNRFELVESCWDGRELLPERTQRTDDRWTTKVESHGKGALVRPEDFRSAGRPPGRASKCSCGRQKSHAAVRCLVCARANRHWPRKVA